jgi:hypothetical protein
VNEFLLDVVEERDDEIAGAVAALYCANMQISFSGEGPQCTLAYATPECREAYWALDDESLERSSTVANCPMNRERNLVGTNGYTKELRFNPLDLLLSSAGAKVRWLDLCRGEGKALVEAAQRVNSHESDEKCEIVGVDLVAPLTRPKPQSPCLTFVQASLNDWQPSGYFDLITCVHRRHYIGDKLGLITRSASWLSDIGQFVAHLVLNNIRFAPILQAHPDGRFGSRAWREKVAGAGVHIGFARLLYHSIHVIASIPVSSGQ